MAHRTWTRVMSRMLLVGFLCGVVGVSTTTEAVAGPAATVIDPTAEQRFVIEQLTADKAMTVANERRIADARQNQLYEQLQATDRELRVAQGRAAGHAAALARVRKARDEIAKQRQELVAALAQRDRTLEAELRAYREAVTAIATSPDPKTQELLRRYANGEQREALAESDVLADADLAARRKASAIASAAKRRPWAILAIQAHDNGKVTLEEVIQKFEKLTQLDPGMTWDWIVLGRLYREQGRLDESQKVAQLAYTSLSGGGNERDRSVVLNELGNIAVQAGDLQDAKARYEEGLGIRRTLAKDDPTSAETQRDLSISLEKLGDIAVQAGVADVNYIHPTTTTTLPHRSPFDDRGSWSWLV
jgi:Tetratricopeptide repeat